MTETTVLHRFVVGEPIQAVLTADELAAGLGYSRTQLNHFRKLKNHPAVDELPGPGHCRFAGRAVKAWLEAGSPAPVRRSFGVAKR